MVLCLTDPPVPHVLFICAVKTNKSAGLRGRYGSFGRTGLGCRKRLKYQILLSAVLTMEHVERPGVATPGLGTRLSFPRQCSDPLGAEVGDWGKAVRGDGASQAAPIRKGTGTVAPLA